MESYIDLFIEHSTMIDDLPEIGALGLHRSLKELKVEVSLTKCFQEVRTKGVEIDGQYMLDIPCLVK